MNAFLVEQEDGLVDISQSIYLYTCVEMRKSMFFLVPCCNWGGPSLGLE